MPVQLFFSLELFDITCRSKFQLLSFYILASFFRAETIGNFDPSSRSVLIGLRWSHGLASWSWTTLQYGSVIVIIVSLPFAFWGVLKEDIRRILTIVEYDNCIAWYLFCISRIINRLHHVLVTKRRTCFLTCSADPVGCDFVDVWFTK